MAGVGGKCRQLYSNNIKMWEKKINREISSNKNKITLEFKKYLF